MTEAAASQQRAKRAADLPTASALAQARATLRAIKPRSELETGLKETLQSVVTMIEQQYERIDDTEDNIERLWLLFDSLVDHRLRVRGLRTLGDAIEEQAAALAGAES
ncbi:MAG: hypothetical protein AAF657_14060 [Acidobacteriota bacterium]